MLTDDRAVELENILLDFSIQGIRDRSSQPRRLLPVGTCHNPACGEIVGKGQLFCNSVCATRYERQKTLNGNQS